MLLRISYCVKRVSRSKGGRALQADHDVAGFKDSASLVVLQLCPTNYMSLLLKCCRQQLLLLLDKAGRQQLQFPSHQLLLLLKPNRLLASHLLLLLHVQTVWWPHSFIFPRQG